MKKKTQKQIKAITNIFLIAGEINLGLVGAFNFDLLNSIFSSFTSWVYILVGIAGFYKIFNFEK